MKIRIFIGVVYFLFLAGTARSDTIYLQNKPKGNTGEVIEEYPDYIVIKFSKNEIKRIEAEEKPLLKQPSSLQKVIWIDDGDTITLRLPKQSVQISGDGELKAVAQNESPVLTTEFEANPVARLQEIAQSPSDRVIQEKVIF